jgi:uncharacterized metal-binding protein
MDVRVVACSGGSNVGQIANDAAIQLAKEKAASFFCLAGVGGHIEGIVKSANKLAGVVTWFLISTRPMRPVLNSLSYICFNT